MKKIVVLSILSFALFFSGYSQKIDWAVLKKELVGTYTGSLKKGLADGKGTTKGQDEYTGDFKKGLPDGVGFYTDSIGNVYTGAFQNGRKEGRGIMVLVGWKEDSIVKGYWDHDNFIGDENIVPYEISNMTGSIRPRIFNQGVGNKVEISVMDPFRHKPIFKGVTIFYTGEATPRNDNFGRFYYEDASFPLDFNIRYTCRNKIGTVRTEKAIWIKINKPGSWVITLEN